MLKELYHEFFGNLTNISPKSIDRTIKLKYKKIIKDFIMNIENIDKIIRIILK